MRALKIIAGIILVSVLVVMAIAALAWMHPAL